MLLGVEGILMVLSGTYFKIKSVDYSCIIIKCERQLCVTQRYQHRLL